MAVRTLDVNTQCRLHVYLNHTIYCMFTSVYMLTSGVVTVVLMVQQ